MSMVSPCVPRDADPDLGRQRHADGVQAAGRLVLRGRFTEAFSARDPSRNLAATTAQEVALDARTGPAAVLGSSGAGEVTAVR